MSPIDKILSVIAIIGCLLSSTLTLRWKSRKIKEDGKEFDDYINDIRAMNNYNSYFLSAIMIFFGFIMEKDINIVLKSSLIMILVSFVFAAVSLFFFPVIKKEEPKDLKNIRARWLCALLPSQWVIVLCVLGIINAVLSKLL